MSSKIFKERVEFDTKYHKVLGRIWGFANEQCSVIGSCIKRRPNLYQSLNPTVWDVTVFKP